MGVLPCSIQDGEIVLDLGGALRQHHVVLLEFDDLAGDVVEAQPMGGEHARQLGVRGDDCRSERPDRALLLEQRSRVEAAPLSGREDTGADLEVDVAMRVPRPRGLVDDRHGLEPVHADDLLESTRTDAGHRVPGQP